MTDKTNQKSGKERLKVEDLKIKKRTVRDLTESEQEAAKGGMRKAGGDPNAAGKEFLTL